MGYARFEVIRIRCQLNAEHNCCRAFAYVVANHSWARRIVAEPSPIHGYIIEFVAVETSVAYVDFPEHAGINAVNGETNLFAR